MRNISIEEVKDLIKFVKDKNNSEVEEIYGNQTSDELELFDLVNVVMDVSLDVFKMNENDHQID